MEAYIPNSMQAHAQNKFRKSGNLVQSCQIMDEKKREISLLVLREAYESAYELLVCVKQFLFCYDIGLHYMFVASFPG